MDVFHDNLIFMRNIGHSELVFNNNFNGEMIKDFSKKWNMEEKQSNNSKKLQCFLCNRHRYVQIYFRRETILSDFEII